MSRRSEKHSRDESIRLLTETEMIEPVREAVRGCSDLRIAVAFWGKDAVRTLGLAKAEYGKIFCKVEPGACNPAEVRKLLRSRLFFRRPEETQGPRSLARVGRWKAVAIVGSSNASANGLVLDAAVAAGWREANIRFEDHIEVAQLGRYFDRLWKESATITKPLLAETEAK